MDKGALLYAGKAKSLYETADPHLLICEFRDDTTAFDGQKHAALKDKGRINNAISHELMSHLSKAGIQTHIERWLSDTEVLVKRLTMIPLESVVRNVAAGSLCRRLGVPQGQPLDRPLYELFLKNDVLHDPMINEAHALAFGWATKDQLSQMEALSIRIHALLTELFDTHGIIYVDAKYEFGVYQGNVVLADEISPDSCRLWDKETLKPLDKDRFRQDLGGVVDGYAEVASRLGLDVTA